MPPYRILHLSDLHLTPHDGDARSEPKLYGHLTGMNAAFRSLITMPPAQEADLVLVSGDVTDRGDLESWRLFWAALDGAGLAARTLVVPGNHDMCCLGVRLGGSEEADRARALAGLALGKKPASSPWGQVLHGGRVLVIGLDSCNAGNVFGLTNAIGRLPYRPLERLARLLARHAAVPVKIVMLHHSPNIPRADVEQRRRLPPTRGLSRWGYEVPADERRALRLLCIAHRVTLVVHGHLHRAEDRRVNGIRIVGAPASTEPGPEGALQVLRYEVDGEPPRVTVTPVSLPA